MVFYAGKIVEEALIEDLYTKTLHPIRLAYLKPFQVRRRKREKTANYQGLPPDLISPPKGCAFHPRCDYSMKMMCNKRAPYFDFKDLEELPAGYTMEKEI